MKLFILPTLPSPHALASVARRENTDPLPSREIPSLLRSVLPFFCQVNFRNEQSGEYLFYYVTFKAIPPGVMSTIDLSTPIRKSTSHVVTLHNPLSTPVTFNSQCSVADIQLPPSFTVPPLSEVGA